MIWSTIVSSSMQPTLLEFRIRPCTPNWVMVTTVTLSGDIFSPSSTHFYTKSEGSVVHTPGSLAYAKCQRGSHNKTYQVPFMGLKNMCTQACSVCHTQVWCALVWPFQFPWFALHANRYAEEYTSGLILSRIMASGNLEIKESSAKGR